MSRFQKLLLIFFFPLFIFGSSLFSQVHAANPLFPAFGDKQPKTPQDYAKEFCDKRSGDLMNLETWFSGKCGPDIDPLSGEGVGFADIVVLQGLEFIYSPQYKNYQDTLIDSLKMLNEIKSKLSSGEITPNQINYASINKGGGLVSSLASVTTTIMETKPASTTEYLAYISNNLKQHKIVKDSFAAGPGYGFTALSPILPLWRAFRNIAYLLFALGFILYGIMIMFRIRIDAKTAATIQLAIPRLVATLLLITFSYAIVGLFVDLSTVFSALFIDVLRVGGILVFNSHPLPIIVSGQSNFGGVGSMLINSAIAIFVSPFIFFNLLIGGFAGIITTFLAVPISIFAGGIGIVISIVVLIAVAISYIKLILMLFKSYISVIVNLIFAPLMLLANLFPGTDAVGSWLRSIYGNLAVFPVASFFLVLSYALMVQPILAIEQLIPNIGTAILQAITGSGGLELLLGVKSLSTLSNIWAPPMTVPGAGMTVLGGSPGTFFGPVGSLMLATIGFGLLLMAAKYVEMVEKALKTPPFPYGAAIGEALRYGAGQAGRIPPEYIPRLGKGAGGISDWLNAQALSRAAALGGTKAQPGSTTNTTTLTS